MLKHVPGHRMEKVNSLSRRPEGVERDNKNKTLVKLEWLVVRKIEKIEIIIEEVDLLEEVR